MSTKPTICYYISSHGYGHAARTRHVLARLAGRGRLIIKTWIERGFFGDVLPTDVEFYQVAVDGGLVQRSNREIDWPASIAGAAARLQEGRAGAGAEAEWLRDRGVDVVVCDIAPLGIMAAARAGVPGLCLANFTWAEIFEPAGAEELAGEFREVYAQATGCLRTPLGFPMEYMPLYKDIDLVAGDVPCCRKELREAVGVPEGDRMVLVYLGNYGHDLHIPEIPGVTMVGYATEHPLIHQINAEDWPAERAIASVDAVLAKPGYSTAAQCMAAGMPMVTYPRPEFAEFFPMIRQLRAWGGCVEMSNEDFEAGNWDPALREAFGLSPMKAPACGAAQAAEAILKAAGVRG